MLKNLFNRIIAWGLYEGTNPVQAVKLRKEPRNRLRFLELEEEIRLLAAAKEPLRTLIVLGIHTGLRLQSEALTLRWHDVDLRRGLVTVQAAFAKNGRTRSVPLDSVVRAALQQLKASAKAEGVFVSREGKALNSIRTAFQTACKAAKLSGVTPHTLRHTFASMLVMSGVDLRAVQVLGGWQTIGMVERYSHLSPAHLAQAVEKLAEFPYSVPYTDSGALSVAR